MEGGHGNDRSLFSLTIDFKKSRFAFWVALSSPFLTSGVVERLRPTARHIYSCAQFASERSTSQERASLPIPARLRRDSQTSDVAPPTSLASGEKQLPDLKTLPETEVSRFTKIVPFVDQVEGPLDPSKWAHFILLIHILCLLFILLLPTHLLCLLFILLLLLFTLIFTVASDWQALPPFLVSFG